MVGRVGAIGGNKNRGGTTLVCRFVYGSKPEDALANMHA